MKIAGLQKLTLLDFPRHTAATVFTPGCNFRCPFCHNADLVFDYAGKPSASEHENGRTESIATTSVDEKARTENENGGNTHAENTENRIPPEEFFAFLDKRKGLLDGVCITGGEPTLQHGLAKFCEEIRARGFKVKLDTNGSHPEVLRELIENGHIDYVAMDVKNAPGRYAETTGVPALDVTAVKACVDMLKEQRIPCEFRTTVVHELHTEENLAEIARWLAKPPRNCQDAAPVCNQPPWFLQSFVDAESVLAGTGAFHAWAPQDLHALLPRLQEIYAHTMLRGI